MPSALLEAALLLLVTASGANPSPPRAEATRAHALLTQRLPGVVWNVGSAQLADVTLDGIPDVVLLGQRAGIAVVAVVAGPLTPTSRHWMLTFQEGPGEEAGLCAAPSEARLSLESPGLPLDEWGCAENDPTEECQQAVAVNKRLLAAKRTKGTRGIRLDAGDCDAHHIYFDGQELAWWRR